MGLPAEMSLSQVAAEFELSLSLGIKLSFTCPEPGLYMLKLRQGNMIKGSTINHLGGCGAKLKKKIRSEGRRKKKSVQGAFKKKKNYVQAV